MMDAAAGALAWCPSGVWPAADWAAKAIPPLLEYFSRLLEYNLARLERDLPQRGLF
jgi:hypothetical protein